MYVISLATALKDARFQPQLQNETTIQIPKTMSAAHVFEGRTKFSVLHFHDQLVQTQIQDPTVNE